MRMLREEPFSQSWPGITLQLLMVVALAYLTYALWTR